MTDVLFTSGRAKGERRMDRLLFLVARDQPDLWDQLNKEFSSNDVAVVVDRRIRERRRGEQSNEEERRQLDRRSREEIDREVRSRGFSVIRLEPGEAGRQQGHPSGVRAVQGYVQERFRHLTTVTSWDPHHDAQSFVIFNRAGRAVHRVCFDREFLSYYGTSSPDRIASILDEWKLPSHLESVGSELVIVSVYGVHGA